MSFRAHEEGPPPPPLSEEERAFRADFAQLVDYYRVSQTGALWRAFWPAALLLLPLGSVLTALARLERLVPPPMRFTLSTLGLCVTAAGPLWCVVSLLRSIRRDDFYVAVRTDGLVLALEPGRPPELFAWDDVVDVRFDAETRAVRVLLREGERSISGSFVDLDLRALGAKLRDARRLAVWHRLTPRFGER